MPAPKSGAGRKLADYSSILVIKPDLIGDVVLCTPFLRELRRNAPAAHIELVVRESVFNMVEKCPYVDCVRSFAPTDSRSRIGRLKSILLAKRLFRLKSYDLGIVPRWDFDLWHASYLLFSSGAKRRVAYSETSTEIKRMCNKSEDLLLTDAVKSPHGIRHELQRNLDLLISLGGDVKSEDLELWTTEDDSHRVDDYLALRGIPSGARVIAVAPASHEPKKQWPAERYVELIRQALLPRCDYVLVFGGASDRLITTRVAESLGSKAVDAGGAFTLRQSVSALKRCFLFVGNDTGTKHMAAAVGIPVIEISGWPTGADATHPLAPERFCAWGVPSRIVRPKITRQQPYILDVSVDQVISESSGFPG